MPMFKKEKVLADFVTFLKYLVNGMTMDTKFLSKIPFLKNFTKTAKFL